VPSVGHTSLLTGETYMRSIGTPRTRSLRSLKETHISTISPKTDPIEIGISAFERTLLEMEKEQVIPK